jgi:ATP-dependent exoDNAse (exonuclease V) beta subunit
MLEDLRKELEVFRDPNFKFDPRYHKYTYGDTKYTSVTTFLKNFHKPFDQDFWSKKKSEELGVPVEEILKSWKDKNDNANMVGSSTHLWIENYFNAIHQTIPTDLRIVDRINKFNKIYATHLYKLQPVAFELRIFSKRYPIAGTLDSLFLYKDKLIIIDYKTNGDFKHDGHPKGTFSKLLDPFGDYWENHHNEYSIQISMYSLILKEWGFHISAGYLLHLGEEEEAKVWKCHDFVPQLESYLETYQFGD